MSTLMDWDNDWETLTKKANAECFAGNWKSAEVIYKQLLGRFDESLLSDRNMPPDRLTVFTDRFIITNHNLAECLQRQKKHHQVTQYYYRPLRRFYSIFNRKDLSSAQRESFLHRYNYCFTFYALHQRKSQNHFGTTLLKKTLEDKLSFVQVRTFKEDFK